MNLTELLRENPHFAALSGDDLEALASAFVVSTVPAGTALFAAGDRGEAVYLVIDGAVEVTWSDRGATHALARHERGELFGLRAVIEHQRRSASCSTATSATLGVMPVQSVTMLINQSAPVAFAFQRALAAQLGRDFRAADRRLRTLMARLDQAGASKG